MQEGLFGRIQKTKRSIVKRAQLCEKGNWRSSAKSRTNRFRQIPVLTGHEDLKVDPPPALSPHACL